MPNAPMVNVAKLPCGACEEGLMALYLEEAAARPFLCGLRPFMKQEPGLRWADVGEMRRSACRIPTVNIPLYLGRLIFQILGELYLKKESWEGRCLHRVRTSRCLACLSA